MHPNAELIRRFYDAFGRRDAEGMAACYADDVRFSDAAFPDLRGRDAGDMWRMLCEAGKDLRIEASDIDADDTTGRARWVAHYTFSATGRKVVNDIRASFRFQNGRIVEHRDTFDFPRWARQALGMPGLLLGWTGWMQKQVQARAAKGLASFQKKRG
ncbi:MAG: nuclear transport factor 2 family protein [Myxococcaceae bacterium]|jgi:ketosteroid isomerase-like protein|nr:nuclear transport factor 2 family protein [Myxococcaceae bacterium]